MEQGGRVGVRTFVEAEIRRADGTVDRLELPLLDTDAGWPQRRRLRREIRRLNRRRFLAGHRIPSDSPGVHAWHRFLRKIRSH